MIPPNIRRTKRALWGSMLDTVFEVKRDGKLIIERLSPISDAEIEDFLRMESMPKPVLRSDQMAKSFDMRRGRPRKDSLPAPSEEMFE